MSTDIVPSKPVAVGRRQSDLEETFRLAKALATSTLLPKALIGKPNDVLVAILYGQELGVQPMQAIQSIYVVNGRPTLAAQLWVALARRAGHKVRVLEETPTACTVEVARADDPDHPTRVTYTAEQAKAAGLTGKDVWKQHGHAMLYARAVSTACRRACPEIALGFGDEADRHMDEPDRPTLAQVAAQREQQPANTAPVEVSDAEIIEHIPAPEPTPARSAEDIRAEVEAIAAQHTDTSDQTDGLFDPDEPR